MKSVLLIVTILGIGGPHGARPARLSDATVLVTRGAPAQTVATSTNGRLKVRLRPGLYTVVALLLDEPLRPPRFCEATALKVKQAQRARVEQLALACGVK